MDQQASYLTPLASSPCIQTQYHLVMNVATKSMITNLPSLGFPHTCVALSMPYVVESDLLLSHQFLTVNNITSMVPSPFSFITLYENIHLDTFECIFDWWQVSRVRPKGEILPLTCRRKHTVCWKRIACCMVHSPLLAPYHFEEVHSPHTLLQKH